MDLHRWQIKSHCNDCFKVNSVYLFVNFERENLRRFRIVITLMLKCLFLLAK